MRTWKHWTHDEDELLRAAARRGYPDLRWIALKLGRSYSTVRWRASRLGALRNARPGEGARGPAVPTGRTCSYCSLPFEATGRAVYCSPECRALAGGHCPGCGRPYQPGAECQWCAAVGKRATWPAAVGALQDDRPASSAGSVAAGRMENEIRKRGMGVNRWILEPIGPLPTDGAAAIWLDAGKKKGDR